MIPMRLLKVLHPRVEMGLPIMTLTITYNANTGVARTATLTLTTTGGTGAAATEALVITQLVAVP